jgi:hypothetical protein
MALRFARARRALPRANADSVGSVCEGLGGLPEAQTVPVGARPDLDRVLRPIRDRAQPSVLFCRGVLRHPRGARLPGRSLVSLPAVPPAVRRPPMPPLRTRGRHTKGGRRRGGDAGSPRPRRVATAGRIRSITNRSRRSASFVVVTCNRTGEAGHRRIVVSDN